MQTLPGFRDFFPEDCARRNYILTKWREVARRYGFVEFDGPVLEPMALYEKKSGGELVGQLFDFVDKGERHVAMRPEMTPTLARMVAARERDFKKPLKWFCVPQFFRYEKQQRGRLREFYQLNCDIIGEASPAADAEMIALLVDVFRAFGFTQNDFRVRLNSRRIWWDFLADRMGTFTEEDLRAFFEIIDKIDRQAPDVTDARLKAFNTSLQDIGEWTKNTGAVLMQPSIDNSSIRHRVILEIRSLIHDHLVPRGLLDYVAIDFSIVRGLAYYTGIVFEAFDLNRIERALAGGGRYDDLMNLMSDGSVHLPALGFGMGDVVLANLIDATPAAAALRDAWLKREHACDLYVVIAKEDRRPDALALVQRLREAGQRVDFPLTPAKVGKQFQTAEQLGATRAVLVGDEWPQVKLKTLATREETLISPDALLATLASLGS